MNIQAPPNLSAGALAPLIDAGINDWGGVSPVTPDHVNPEAPWPHLEVLERATKAAGKELVERLAIYPAYARSAHAWVDPSLQTRLLHNVDADGWPRTDEWSPGNRQAHCRASRRRSPHRHRGKSHRSCSRVGAGVPLSEQHIVATVSRRGDEFAAVCAAADALRREASGDVVSYVVIPQHQLHQRLLLQVSVLCVLEGQAQREPARPAVHAVDCDEIARRAREAWDRGATEVCMQGGIHPSYTGETYLDICARG